MLKREFYERNTVEVAQDLIGKILVFNNFEAIITETEAYRAEGDAACHGHRGITKRSSPLFGPPAMSYVYLIYGMYNCLNFVTEPEHTGGAVLIRGMKLLNESAKDSEIRIFDGPGKICRFLNINYKDHNQLSLLADKFHIHDVGQKIDFATTPRIGISKAADLPWRFVVDKKIVKNL